MRSRDFVRYHLGAVEDIPVNHCIAVADGDAVVTRVGSEIVAFKNQCLHQESPLEAGVILDGILICPLHFWRYEMPSGRLKGRRRVGLERYDVVIEKGEAWLDLPIVPKETLREKLLQHAERWKRDQ